MHVPIFKDPWVYGSLLSAIAGISFGLTLPFITTEGKTPLFEGHNCKVQYRFSDVRCGQRTLRLGEITLRDGTSPERLKPGDKLTCSRPEDGGAKCDLVTETPT